MQFLPSFSSESAFGAVQGPQAVTGFSTGSAGGHTPGKTSDPNSFLQSLNEELAEQGVTPVVDISLEDKLPTGFRTLARDKASKLNSDDISYITDALRKKGVKDSALTAIEDMLASGNIPTLGNLMGMVSGTGRATEDLTDQEVAEVGGLLRKMGFSQEEIDNLQIMMDEGDTHQAMQTIAKRAQAMGKEGFSMTKSELNSLMRGLDISDDAKKKITALFGDNESIELSGEALDKMLRPALVELADKKEALERMANELKGVINDALQAKKIREATESVADARGSKLTERAETRMRDDMTAKANGLGKNPREAALEDEEAALAEDAADQEYANEQRNAEQKKTAAERRLASLFSTGAENSASRQDGASSSMRDAASTIFTRFDIAANVDAPAQTLSQNAAATANAHRQEIFSQVEQGLLSQTQDGSHKMTLQLDPVDLGRVTLMLTVKGGEVRAVIKAENPETTAVLTERIDQLRASLEEQGLKVAEIDIETRMQDDTTRDRQWADTSGFNMEQEMREQARFSRLSKLRREAGTTLAQDMQGRGRQEEISETGLHIIA